MEKKKKEAEERKMEEERKAALMLEQEKEDERLQDEKALKNVLRGQINELKHRESEVNGKSIPRIETIPWCENTLCHMVTQDLLIEIF